MRSRAHRLATSALFAALVAGVAAMPASGRTPHLSQASFVPGEVVVKLEGQRFGRAVELPPGVGVREVVGELRRDPDVAYATPNFIATATAIPNDPGTPPGRQGPRGGWAAKQWNFLPCGNFCRPGPKAQLQSPGGIDALAAWRNLRTAGRAGASGIKVAVLDTGIAYRTLGERFQRSPDFAPGQFLEGRDYVGDDTVPLDLNGHGTHIAGTIAERTGNGLGMTGLAYRSKLIPVRVLNAAGNGQADDIARGIRFAARKGAQVINMSFNFECGASSIPLVDEALRFAHDRGAVLVASAGNSGCIAAPALSPDVVTVGGTTEGGCRGFYSPTGPEIDLVAPGGGVTATPCESTASRPVLQVTFRGQEFDEFGLPRIYEGTSMSAAHVSGVAAMVIASGVVGRSPSPKSVVKQLKKTARDLGAAGTDDSYGHGLIDAGAATAD